MGYWLLRWLIRLWLGARLDVVVEGAQHLPARGAAILASNHPCAIDGALLVSVIGRRLRVFSRAENFASPLSSTFLRVMGALPTRATAGSLDHLADNLGALERAEEWLARGEVLFTAPEGDVNPGPALGPFRRGFLYLAIESGAPVIPVAIVGSERALAEPRRPSKLGRVMLRRTRVEIAFLEPERFRSGPDVRAVVEEGVARVRDRIEAAVLARLAS